jgi:hypothetical protein
MHIFGAAAHVLVLEAAHPVANSSFDFALRLHGHLDLQGDDTNTK